MCLCVRVCAPPVSVRGWRWGSRDLGLWGTRQGIEGHLTGCQVLSGAVDLARVPAGELLG